MKCEWCGKEIINKRRTTRFCSYSCSSTSNNRKRKKTNNCLDCGNIIQNSSIRCLKCNYERRKYLTSLKDKNCLCKECGKKYIYKGSSGGSTKNLCTSCKLRAYARSNKQKAIDYKGGYCQICGYNKCNQALVFHHINPNEKEFSISEKAHHSLKNIKLELDRCILLCCRCHAEIHAGIENLNIILERKK